MSDPANAAAVPAQGEPGLPSRRWVTPLLWLVGVGLQVAAPLLRDRVPLSDDLLIESILAPVWVFLLVVILAVWLRVFRTVSQRWSSAVRIAFAVVSAGVLMLLQPDLITQLVDHAIPLSANPMRVALIWSTPLAFYVIPAGVVVFAWLAGPVKMTLVRALGIGLVAIGVLNFAYILWLTHLWDTYIRPQGGGTA